MNYLPLIYAILASQNFMRMSKSICSNSAKTPPDYTNELSILTNKEKKNLGGNPQFIDINPN